MTKTTLLCLLLSFQLYGQSSNKHEDIIPKDLKVKSLIDSNNYIHDSIRVLILSFLQSKNLSTSDYFVDSFILDNPDSTYIHLYHSKGLKHLKEIEIQNEKSEFKTHVVGNPGGSITVLYSKKQKSILGLFYSQ